MGSARASFSMFTIKFICAAFALALLSASPLPAQSGPPETPQTPPQRKTPSGATASTESRPKLVVILVVDQMRGDYIDKFQGQWTGGLKRLVDQGAWFHEAAYPYAATETCVGHSTVSTGAFPATHGMIANEWWDREQQKEITCTSDPTVKNIAYAGAAVSAAAGAPRALGPSELGGDSPSRMLVPAFADELKFQSGSGTRIVTMSLKARAAITLAGHQGDAGHRREAKAH